MLETMLKRRSCRDFKAQKVEAEKIEKLLQVALLSPSGKNTKPCEFIVVEDKSTLESLGNCRNPLQPFLPKTPLAIVVLGDTSKTDTWIEDASIASITMQLEAKKLGLGSCWVQIRLRESNQGISSEEYIRHLFNIPEHLRVLSIIALGYPNKTLPSHTLEEVKMDKVHYEKY